MRFQMEEHLPLLFNRGVTANFLMVSLSQGDGTEINLKELEDITTKHRSEMIHHVALLEKYEFIKEPEAIEYNLPVTYFKQYDHWDMWNTIKDYSDLSSISLEEIITNMRFSLLD